MGKGALSLASLLSLALCIPSQTLSPSPAAAPDQWIEEAVASLDSRQTSATQAGQWDLPLLYS